MLHRIALTAAVAVPVAAFGTYALIPDRPATAKDDPAKIKANREEKRAELKEKKFYFFHDLSYWVDTKKTDGRWNWQDPPPFSTVSEEEGGQFYAVMSAPDGKEWLKIVAIKHPHFKREGSMQSNYQIPFKNWGKSVRASDADGVVEGMYEDWIRAAKDVIKDKCQKPGKKNFGPAKFFAAAVGTDPEENRRIRKEWYVWSDNGLSPPVTWVVIATIDGMFLDKPDMVEKTQLLVSAMKPIDQKGLK